MQEPLATPTSQSGPHAEGPQSQQPPKTGKQRFKPQLSCTFCRNRKLKCDRQLPCENCVKRNSSSSCTYIHGQRDRSAQVQKSGNSTKDVQSQVRHLEELVISLMNKTTKNSAPAGQPQPFLTPDESTASGSSNATSPSQSPEQVANSNLDTAESFGRITIEDDQLNYVGSSHWTAILDNISELKDRLGVTESAPKENGPADNLSAGPDLLVGSVRGATRAEVMAALPSRSVMDALVAEFFATPDMGCALYHVPSFMREYERFWVNPSAMPIMWIGMLFSILSLSVQFCTLSKKSLTGILSGEALREPQDAIDNYREKTVQCLILGNYTEPSAYTVETLILYYICDHFRTADAQFGCWMVFGLIVRAAMRLGYHRDASHFPKISVFKGEIQRRLWHMIVHLDIINSLQVGLPRMIRESSYDTREPRNLDDKDFDENATELPPARSNGEVSSMVYMNAKHKVTEVFGKIVDQSNSTHPISYEEVMKLDKLLHEVHQTLPPTLSGTNVEELNSGLPQTKIRRFTIDLTFQKARCVLHRKWFFPKKGTAIYPYPYSMKVCIESSMRVLQTQIIMYGETAPDKSLHDHKWRASSLITHDFLLAAMLICLYLGYSLAAENAGQSDVQTGIRVTYSREDMLQALQDSYLIWEELSSTSKEASKVAKALKSMLTRVKSPDTVPPTAKVNQQEAFKLTYNAFVPPSSIQTPASQQIQNDHNTPNIGTPFQGLFRAATIPPFSAPADQSASTIPQFSQNIGHINTADTMELDWGQWDNFLFTTNPGDGDTPPDLWNFEPNFSLPADPNANFMQWNQQL